MIRFGVLGTGRITRRLVADLQQATDIRVTGIASRDNKRARWFADQFGIPLPFGGYDALINSDEIDAVYIAVPPSLHADLSIAAAKAGKHILCEKPLSVSYQQALDIDDTCKTNSVRWLDATGWVHHPRTARIKQIIASGTLGQIKHISTSVSFFEPFQSGDHRLDASLGGGVLLDLGWYAFGLPVWVAEAAPRQMLADCLMRGEVTNRVSAICRFEGNMTATVQCGYDIATRKWIEIAGDQASVICDDFTRPWPDRPARFWIHDRAGSVHSEQFVGHQEAEMIKAFLKDIAGEDSLDRNRSQALSTQLSLEMAASAGIKVNVVS